MSSWVLRKFVLEFVVFCIFLVVTAFALLRAYGYQFNSLDNGFLKTSIIDLSSTVSHVRVMLDGKYIADHLPFQIKDVVPGKYAVRIERNGFLPWEFFVQVAPDKVYKYDGIVMIPQDVEKSLVAPEAKDVAQFEGVRVAFQNFMKDQVGKVSFVTFDASGMSGRFVKENALYTFSFDPDVSGKNYSVAVNSVPVKIKEKDVDAVKHPFYSDNGLLIGTSDTFLRLRQGDFSLVTLFSPQVKTRFLSRWGSVLDDLKWYQEGANVLFRSNEALQFCDERFLNCYELLHLDAGDSFFVFDKIVAVYREKDQKWFTFQLRDL